jgi:hypothetical protein
MATGLVPILRFMVCILLENILDGHSEQAQDLELLARIIVPACVVDLYIDDDCTHV